MKIMKMAEKEDFPFASVSTIESSDFMKDPPVVLEK